MNFRVSIEGVIRNAKTKYVLRQQCKGDGYMRVVLSSNGVHKNAMVHRLVATAFCPKEHETQNQVNHKNKNRADNRSINLEWVTPSANVIHAQSKHVARINDDGTMTIYDSAITAARQLIQEAQTNSRDIHVATRIRKCIKESFRTYLGFHWTLV